MNYSVPRTRRLRVYAFDPSFANRLDLALVNRVTLEVPWEFDAVTGKDALKPGPVGEYLEVVDVDPASGFFYPPVDLNHPYLLAQDGLDPAVGNPQFHQQMTYAVATKTIQVFERALGRCVLWRGDNGRYVPRLRIYPHALREANAYYSPDRRALLFGYFPASGINPGRNLPGETIYTCLSHEIIAHETTHALLDGMQQRFLDATNPDVLALHEAFADVVALFQHFSFPQVVRHEIAKTRGAIGEQNQLAKLAVQFGEATGRYGALRDALGKIVNGKWVPTEPDPKRILRVTEPHERGTILVAALFDAFVEIYKARTVDLIRIATGGSGKLPPGEIHPDLVNRLATEASKSAAHVLQMCIRAIDYCPPVDVTFGDYLRALITADFDLVPNDDRGYRIAIIEAFRQRGIYPQGIKSLSVDSVRWQDAQSTDDGRKLEAFLQTVRKDTAIFQKLRPDWGLSTDRKKVFDQVAEIKQRFKEWLVAQQIAKLPGLEAMGRAMGLELGSGAPPTVKRVTEKSLPEHGLPELWVHSIRPARRQGPDGEILVDLVLQITQARRGYLNANTQREADAAGNTQFPPQDFDFPGGCTLVVDLTRDRIRYCIGKNIDSRKRLETQRKFHTSQPRSGTSPTYFGALQRAEPFALLHRSTDEHGGPE